MKNLRVGRAYRSKIENFKNSFVTVYIYDLEVAIGRYVTSFVARILEFLSTIGGARYRVEKKIGR